MRSRPGKNTPGSVQSRAAGSQRASSARARGLKRVAAAKLTVEGIDAMFDAGGLVRSRHGAPFLEVRASRFDRAAQEELARAAPQPRIAANGAAWLPVPGWDFPWLWSGFSTRVGGISRAYCGEDAPGELNLGFRAEDTREAVAANRRLLAEAVTGDASSPLIALKQFHSNLVVRAAAADAGRERPRRADGQITDERGILLAVQTADCIPVIVADRKRRAVGVFHAGWRGTVKRIAEVGVGRMRLDFGSKPEDMVAAIGPGNGVCCYAVGEEVLSEFDSQFSYARELFREVYDADVVRQKYPMLFLTQRAPGHSPIGPSLHVDLIEANRRQLLAAGLSADSITVVGGCTQCHPKLFYSHRGSQGRAGRMMAVVGIRP
ncbi:MAG: peptidoglycan editing factor PgeF [Terracidiphilus sp.]